MYREHHSVIQLKLSLFTCRKASNVSVVCAVCKEHSGDLKLPWANGGHLCAFMAVWLLPYPKNIDESHSSNYQD